MQQTLRTEARAFVIWRYATPREWDCTVAELAEALELTRAAVYHVLRKKGWQGRVTRDLVSMAGRGERNTSISAAHHARVYRASTDEMPLDKLLR